MATATGLGPARKLQSAATGTDKSGCPSAALWHARLEAIRSPYVTIDMGTCPSIGAPLHANQRVSNYIYEILQLHQRGECARSAKSPPLDPLKHQLAQHLLKLIAYFQKNNIAKKYRPTSQIPGCKNTGSSDRVKATADLGYTDIHVPQRWFYSTVIKSSPIPDLSAKRPPLRPNRPQEKT